jgi:hypothetical protein
MREPIEPNVSIDGLLARFPVAEEMVELMRTFVMLFADIALLFIFPP